MAHETAEEVRAIQEYQEIEDATAANSEATLENMQRYFSKASFQSPLVPDAPGLEFNRTLRRYLDHQHIASKRVHMGFPHPVPARLALPYDNNRVTLPNRPDLYINGSWITCRTAVVRCPKFLVTQTPHELQRADWWQVVWEHGVEVIAVVRRIPDWDEEAYWPTPVGTTIDLRRQKHMAMRALREILDGEIRSQGVAARNALIGPLFGFLGALAPTSLHPPEYERSVTALLRDIENGGRIQAPRAYFSHNSLVHIISGSAGARSYVRDYFERGLHEDPQLLADVAELSAALGAEREKEAERLGVSHNVYKYLRSQGRGSDPLRLTYDSETRQGPITRRLFTLQCGGLSRQITHLMLDWPGSSTVSLPIFVEYLSHVKDAFDRTGGHGDGPPILVHCAAGIGRSGTFIMLYILSICGAALEEVKVKDLLISLRAQRPSLVETPQQYAMTQRGADLFRRSLNRAGR